MIDCHQHIGHFGRSAEHVIAHLDGIGAAKAWLLPLEDRGGIGGGGTDIFPTEVALETAARWPDRIVPFCHVDIRREDALARITAYAERGCKGYGEQKQSIPLSDPRIARVLALCNDLGWPVTFHFQEGARGLNAGIEHLPVLMERFPHVRFVGHAQSFWAHISAQVPDPRETLYPKGPVVPGGLVDRWLADFPNLYADLSAGSGQNALTRDEEFAAGFVRRHWRKLLFATDCPCRDGHGEGFPPGCVARETLPLLRRLAPGPAELEAILHGNAERLIA